MTTYYKYVHTLIHANPNALYFPQNYFTIMFITPNKSEPSMYEILELTLHSTRCVYNVQHKNSKKKSIVFKDITLILSLVIICSSQARHQNEIRKVFLRRFPLSRFLAKSLRVNKIAMKSFSNLSFGIDFKL